MMDAKTLLSEYRGRLTDDILPFWLEHGFDRINGGLYTGIDRDGTLLESDKSIWFQGRALWTYATAYVETEKKAEYLELCDSLVSFIEDHGFDDDGRMFFRVTKDGKPVIKRIRYFFSELFAVLGFAAYSRATGKQEYANKAFDLFAQVLEYRESDVLVPKFNRDNAPSRGFGVPMILLNTAQELRKACPEHAVRLTGLIDALIAEIRRYFVRPDMRLVLEQCAPDGAFQADHFEGRLLNPGHAIEGAWFVMNEARMRNGDADLVSLGTTMLDWMWERGWDEKYGGIIYFRDALGKSATEYWHDMKFWWPQNEAAIANLMAFSLTGNTSYADNFMQVHEYVHTRFADGEYGEWFGYLHRDGTLSTPLKGNMYKGPFHIPRMYLVCIDLLKGLA